jgi:hypothetical protein
MFMLPIFAKAQDVNLPDLPSRLALGITTDKTFYSVKEPIKLTLSFINKDDKPFIGTFAIFSLDPNVKVYYKKVDKGFDIYNFTYTHGRYGPSEIQSDTEDVLNVLTLLYDTKKQKFAFAEPGEYELKVIYKSIDFDSPSLQLESNILRINIVMLEGEEKALQAYSDEFVARLIQGDGFFDIGENAYRAAIDRAINLAQNYPNSFYTKLLINSKLKDLHREAQQSSLGQLERALYEVLKEQDTEGLLEERRDGNSQVLDQKAIDFFLKKATKAVEQEDPKK